MYPIGGCAPIETSPAHYFMDVEATLIDRITEKVDWAILDRETRDQVKVMIEVCADLWLGRPEQARKLEKSIISLWGDGDDN
jgi:hypothetical protein